MILDFATFEGVATLVIALLSTSGATTFLNNKLGHRKQNATDFETINNKLSVQNDKLEKNIEDLQQEKAQRQTEYEALLRDGLKKDTEISRLRMHIGAIEASLIDIPIAFWTKDITLRMSVISKEFEKLFLHPIQKKAEDYLGKRDSEVFQTIKAAPFVDLYEKSDKYVQQHRKTIQTIEPFLDSNGKTIYLHVKKYPQFFASMLVGIGGVIMGVYETLEETKHLKNIKKL